MQLSNSFPKNQHLCGEIRISKLYTDGTAFIAYPFRVVFIIEEKTSDIPIQLLVSVPKKRFKRAVKRNRIKRLMREAYRLNKGFLHDICIEKNINIKLALNYVADVEMEFKVIETKMINALTKISEKTGRNT